jgi:hypothetical protein
MNALLGKARQKLAENPIKTRERPASQNILDAESPRHAIMVTD